MVDTYRPDSVALRPTATTARTTPDAGSFGGDVGRAVQNAGQALDRVGDTAQRIADSQAETRVRELDVALSTTIQEETVTGEAALSKLQGQAYVDAAPEYLSRIEAKVRDLSANPRNGLEQRMISDLTARRLAEVRQSIQGQAIKEAEFANKASAAARVATTTSDTAYAYRDTELYAKRKAALDAAIADDLTAKGIFSPAAFQASRLEKLSGVHAYAIDDMVRLGETGPAQSRLDRAIVDREIDPSVASRLQERLEKAVTENEITLAIEGQQPATVVDGVVGSAPPELVSAVVWQETRGNAAAVSPKGAAGLMQVMPDTAPEAARLAGEAWDAERYKTDKAYQLKLGTAYLNAQLKTFRGSTVAALAAYNAGPGMVQDWIDGTNKTGKNKGGLKLGDPTANPRAWAKAIPFEETRNYVASITARLGGSAKTPLPQSIMDVGEAEAWAQQFPAKDRQAARSAAMSVVSRNRAAQNQRESDAWDAVQPYLRSGGTWTSIPKQLWQRVSPEHQTALMAAAERGDNRTTSPELLSDLYSLMETDPTAFKQKDLLKLAPELSPSDFEQFRKLQHSARTGTGEWKTPAAQYSMVTRNMPTVAPPSLSEPKNKPLRLQFQNRWWQAVQAKQATQTEPLTDDEVVEVGTRLTAEVAISGAQWWQAKTKPLYQVGVDEKRGAADIKIIPPDEYTQVLRQLKSRNPDHAPTNREVLDTWRAAKALN